MKFQIATEKDKESYERFVNKKAGTTCMQMWQWADFRNKLGKKIYERVFVKENGSIKLTANIAINSFKVLGNILYIPQGPIWESSGTLNEFTSNIINFAKERNCFSIVCEPRVQKDSGEFNDLINAGFLFTDKAVQPRCTIFLDISKNEEELLAGFSRTTRYNIGYAKRKGIEIKHFNKPCDISRIDDFYKLILMTQDRKYFHIQPLDYFKNLWLEFSNDGKADLFEAWYNREHLGTILTLNNDIWSASLFSASSRKYDKFKPIYLARWDSIKNAKSKGCQIYDFFGATDSNDSSHPFYYTTQHKLGFEKKFKRFAGTFEIILNPVKYRIWRFLESKMIFKFYEDSFLKVFRNANKKK